MSTRLTSQSSCGKLVPPDTHSASGCSCPKKGVHCYLGIGLWPLLLASALFSVWSKIQYCLGWVGGEAWLEATWQGLESVSPAHLCLQENQAPEQQAPRGPLNLNKLNSGVVWKDPFSVLVLRSTILGLITFLSCFAVKLKKGCP